MFPPGSEQFPPFGGAGEGESPLRRSARPREGPGWGQVGDAGRGPVRGRTGTGDPVKSSVRVRSVVRDPVKGPVRGHAGTEDPVKGPVRGCTGAKSGIP